MIIFQALTILVRELYDREAFEVYDFSFTCFRFSSAIFTDIPFPSLEMDMSSGIKIDNIHIYSSEA